MGVALLVGKGDKLGKDSDMEKHVGVVKRGGEMGIEQAHKVVEHKHGVG